MKRSTTMFAGALLAASLLAACGDDDKSGSSAGGDYCAKIQAYKDKSDALDAVFTETPEAGKVEEAFTAIQTMVNDLKSDAPDEIKADVATMSTAIDNVVAIFSQYDWDFVALAAAPEFAALQEDLAGADMQAASERLQAYSETECGIVDDTAAP